MANTNAAVAAVPDEAMIESLREKQRQRAKQLHGEILVLVGRVGVVQSQLGRALKPMRDDALFKYLEPPFESWKAYLEHGLGCSHAQVLKWILVGERFDDRQVEKYGVERLNGLAQILLKTKSEVPADLDNFIVAFDDGQSARFGELTAQALYEISKHGHPLGEAEPRRGESAVSEQDAALNKNIGGDEQAWAELVRGELHELDLDVEVKPGKHGPRVHFSIDFDQIRTFMRLLPERGLIVDLPDSVEPQE